jgi:hypothetical protein
LTADPPNLETNEKKATWIFDFKKAVTKETAFFVWNILMR